MAFLRESEKKINLEGEGGRGKGKEGGGRKRMQEGRERGGGI